MGSIGDVTEPLTPTGQVRVLGELWSAHANLELPRGTRVRVLAVQDLTLEVEAAKPRLNGRSPGDE